MLVLFAGFVGIDRLFMSSYFVIIGLICVNSFYLPLKTCPFYACMYDGSSRCFVLSSVFIVGLFWTYIYLLKYRLFGVNFEINLWHSDVI